jgi:hypothetical protein
MMTASLRSRSCSAEQPVRMHAAIAAIGRLEHRRAQPAHPIEMLHRRLAVQSRSTAGCRPAAAATIACNEGATLA